MTKKQKENSKQALGILAVISVLAGAAAFAIPAGNAIVDLFSLTRIQAASLWFLIAAISGSIAYGIDREEKMKGKL